MTALKRILNREVNLKSLIIIFLLSPILFILTVIMISFICGLVWSFLPMHYKDKMILKGYYEKEEYFQEDGFQDHTDYCKYFYKKLDDDKFINNIKYEIVKEENIEGLKGYFGDTRNWMNIEGRSKEFDFNNDIISIGDYYYLDLKESGYNNYNVYFYDIETHILYYIHSNI